MHESNLTAAVSQSIGFACVWVAAHVTHLYLYVCASLLSPAAATTCIVYRGATAGAGGGGGCRGGRVEDPASILNTHQTPSRTPSIASASPGRLPTVRFVSVRARKTEALKIALLNPQGFNSCRPTLYHLSRARQAKPRKRGKKW